MKKILIVFAALIGLVVIIMVAAPVIFKDDIQKAVDTEMANSLNASVFYDTDDISISLFKHFPNLTLSLSNFGITGHAPFEGDTLMSVGTFEITVDVMSAISGDQIMVNDVLLDRPKIYILVLEDGTANYDIAVDSDEPAEEAEEEPAESSDMSIAIEHWEIRNGDVIYYDESLAFYTTLFGIYHSGNGDFSMDVFDMVTTTTINEFSLGYDGDEYITNKTLGAEITMAMDMAQMKFTFKENEARLNDFAFGFDGFVSMPDENIDMDITYSGHDIDMKSILSLIPGLYQEYMEGVSASGNVGFEGSVRGTYNEESMPKVAAGFTVEDGKISYADYPIPMEAIQISSSFDYPSADLRESSFTVDNFSMLVDGEKFTASLLFKDFEDYFWDLKVDGSIDLEKVLKIVPIEETELTGKIFAQMSTTGRMSDLEAEKYEKLVTSGSMKIENLNYTSDLLPQGFGIQSAEASFNPQVIKLSSFKGNAGKTDLNLSGDITNYMQYALADDATLKGKFNFSSALVDVNEWMATEEVEEVETAEEDTVPMEIIRIPTNVDFELASSIDELIYDNLTLKDFKGLVLVREGSLYLNGVRFDMLDGSFEMNGIYAAAGEEEPTFDFDFNIKELSIPDAFRSFTTVQKLVPFAEKLNGKFSTDFKLGGAIGEGMMPVYSSLTGAGLIEVAQASMQNVKLLSAISSVSSLKQKDGSVSMKDVLLSAELKDGSVFVKPFDVTLGGYKATIAGSNSIDGSLNYAMVVKDVSTGAVGQAVNSALSSFVGVNNATPDKVDINFGIGGTFLDPKVNLKGAAPAGDATGQSSLKAAAKSKVQDEVDKQTAEIKTQVTDTLQVAKDSAKTVIKETKDKLKEEAADKAKDAVKNLFGKKKKKGGG